ncbi:GIY-YIG nuclease family protein [Thiohalophilus thiocyanatoxydans]|uniref:GIY-YIG nuclease family protein n=1 Tax=Thiohalophilus thiocyanatoxydans TaxID=381308 RepID=UPI001AB04460|nr:GIY-YIG nuclease family protein [Thiohalophilus thiocyanatoxydans]
MVRIDRIYQCEHGKYVVDVYLDNGEFYFTSHHFETKKEAELWAESWCYWANNLIDGGVDTVYYILQVPDTWPGPPIGANPYSGLFVKIGRSKNVLQRLQNLQTGTYGELIIHALEPGGSERESELHRQFSSLRRHGEWFACSTELTNHIYSTWYKNKMLPPEHQYEVLKLAHRIQDYKQIRQILGHTPDTVNPALDDEWHGTTMIDLVYSSLAKNEK